jgi:hypothetical protein
LGEPIVQLLSQTLGGLGTAVCWSHLLIYLSIYISIHPSIYLSIHPSIYLSIEIKMYIYNINLNCLQIDDINDIYIYYDVYMYIHFLYLL